MKFWHLLASIIVCLIIGFVLGSIIGLNSLQGVAFVLAGLAFGLVLGFLLDWLLEEAYRRNRELERQVQTAQQRSLPQAQAVSPAPSVTPDSKDQESASQSLTDIIHRRDEEIKNLQLKIEQTEQEMEKLQESFDSYIKHHPDDMSVIKGIGSVYEWKLRDIGINTFQQLAEADEEKLRRMLDIEDWKRIDIKSWIDQARDWAQRE
jgi:predicted flap endonuclease-1-like 5' DNA nuclease